jgi:hypothetical protein
MNPCRARRHGKVAASFLGDQLRLCDRDNARQELNQWHAEYALKSLPDAFRDDIYLSVSSDAKRFLFAQYPRFSYIALHFIVDSMYANGQLARKKDFVCATQQLNLSK